MKNLTRRDFLKTSAALTAASATFGLGLPVFADSTDAVDPEKIMMELNAWYHQKGINFVIDSVILPENVSMSEIKKDIQTLQTLQVSHKETASKNELAAVTRSGIMVSYSYTGNHELEMELGEGTAGCLYIDITVSGTVDLSNNNVVSARGSATERRGINLENCSIGSVNTSINSPSTGYVSYSCPCSGRFAWTGVISGTKYSGTASDTFSGSFPAYEYF